MFVFVLRAQSALPPHTLVRQSQLFHLSIYFFPAPIEYYSSAKSHTHTLICKWMNERKMTETEIDRHFFNKFIIYSIRMFKMAANLLLSIVSCRRRTYRFPWTCSLTFVTSHTRFTIARLLSVWKCIQLRADAPDNVPYWSRAIVANKLSVKKPQQKFQCFGSFKIHWILSFFVVSSTFS